MATNVKLSDFGVFYSALDYGCSTTNTAEENTTAINALISTIGTDTGGGGVIVIPQGVEHNISFTNTTPSLPMTTEAVTLLQLTGDSFKLRCNKTHETVLRDRVFLNGQLYGSVAIISSYNDAGAGIYFTSLPTEEIVILTAASPSLTLLFPVGVNKGHKVRVLFGAAIPSVSFAINTNETHQDVEFSGQEQAWTAGSSVEYILYNADPEGLGGEWKRVSEYKVPAPFSWQHGLELTEGTTNIFTLSSDLYLLSGRPSATTGLQLIFPAGKPMGTRIRLCFNGPWPAGYLELVAATGASVSPYGSPFTEGVNTWDNFEYIFNTDSNTWYRIS